MSLANYFAITAYTFCTGISALTAIKCAKSGDITGAFWLGALTTLNIWYTFNSVKAEITKKRLNPRYHHSSPPSLKKDGPKPI